MQQAQLLTAQGFRITPLKTNKRPAREGHGAEHPEYTCTDRAWYGDSNTMVGILCGPCPALGATAEDPRAGDWLLLVEVDGELAKSADAQAFWDALPATLTSHNGRHRYYRVPNGASVELGGWTDVFGTKAAGTAIDLRWLGTLGAERGNWAEGTDTSRLVEQISVLPAGAINTLISVHGTVRKASRSGAGAGCGGSSGSKAAFTGDSRDWNAWIEERGFNAEQVFSDADRWLVEQAPVNGDATLMVAVGGVFVGWGLPRDLAYDLLEQAYNPRCTDADGNPWPWSAKELGHALDSIETKGSARFQPLALAWVARNTRDFRDTSEAEPANDATAAPPAEEVRPRDRGQDPGVNELIARLSSPQLGVYQRGGRLSVITREAIETDGTVRPIGAPTIRDLVPARLKEIIRTTCGARDVALAGDVFAREEWAYIRPLDAIVTYPVLRQDGTILISNGYDSATHTLAEIDVRVTVADAPDHAAAAAALAILTDPIQDFPFASGAQRSAWVAMLLTVLARPAIDGPTPLGLLEASQRGSGKSLLADVISVIATGRVAPRRVAPKTKEEWDKSMLAVLLAGDPIVLIDNVTTMLASDALDAVLTGTTFTQRVLGVSEERRVPIRTVFLASSNNARLSSDLVRRSIACRLEPAVEQPEQRTGFRHPDLLAHVRAQRAELLAAALTVLRAYVVAGRPPVAGRRMGSYESWCRVVRDALIWAGGQDPAATQDALRETADVERDELRDLLIAWHDQLGDTCVTVRTLLDSARDVLVGKALLDALRGIMPNGVEPTSHTIGNRLRTFRGQVVGGLVLRQGKEDAHKKTLSWQVCRL